MQLKKWFKSMETKDERIKQETNKIAAKLYPLTVVLLLIVLTTKLLIFKFTWLECLLELGALLIFFSYVTLTFYYGVPFKPSHDEQVAELQNKLGANCFYMTSFLFVFLEVFFLSLADDMRHMLGHVIIWFIPTLIFTIQVIGKGLFIWGGKSKRTLSLKSMKLRVFLGSVFFGIFVGWDFMFIDGVFIPKGMLWVIGLAVGWGIPFYFVMKLMVDFSEKKADKKID